MSVVVSPGSQRSRLFPSLVSLNFPLTTVPFSFRTADHGCVSSILHTVDPGHRFAPHTLALYFFIKSVRAMKLKQINFSRCTRRPLFQHNTERFSYVARTKLGSGVERNTCTRIAMLALSRHRCLFESLLKLAFTFFQAPVCTSRKSPRGTNPWCLKWRKSSGTLPASTVTPRLETPPFGTCE